MLGFRVSERPTKVMVILGAATKQVSNLALFLRLCISSQVRATLFGFESCAWPALSFRPVWMVAMSFRPEPCRVLVVAVV